MQQEFSVSNQFQFVPLINHNFGFLRSVPLTLWGAYRTFVLFPNLAHSIFVFLMFYLFMRDTHTERCRDTGSVRSRLHARSLMWDSIPDLQDQALGWRQHKTAVHPGTLISIFEWIICIKKTASRAHHPNGTCATYTGTWSPANNIPAILVLGSIFALLESPVSLLGGALLLISLVGWPYVHGPHMSIITSWNII